MCSNVELLIIERLGRAVVSVSSIFDWPVGQWLETLSAKPEVVGSINTQDRYLCDEHEYFVLCLGVIYRYMFVFKNRSQIRTTFFFKQNFV